MPSEGRHGRTVVIGLGNTTLTDDGAGPRAAQQLRHRLGDRRDVHVTERATGGLALMEAMEGFDRAVVLDALRTGRVRTGTVVELDPGDLGGSLHQASVHDMSLPAALEVGRVAGVPLPERVRILGIEVEDVTTFGERLTPAVSAALPELVRRTLALLEPDVPGAARVLAEGPPLPRTAPTIHALSTSEEPRSCA